MSVREKLLEQSRACRHRRACEEFRYGDIDTDFAKEQLDLMLESFYLHPTGQIPAYEWNFSDVNPPVHAWGSIFLYRTEQALYGGSDIDFLERSFAKLSFLIAINPSDLPLQARIRVPWAELAGTTWKLTDMLAEVTYEREGNEMLSPGLYLELRPWGLPLFLA